LNEIGYPFKSKEFSQFFEVYANTIKKGKETPKYLKIWTREKENTNQSKYVVPNVLMPLIKAPPNFKISKQCCYVFKKAVAKEYEKVNNRHPITGMRKEEGGTRTQIHCAVNDKDGNIIKFHPLAPVSDSFMNSFIKYNNIKLCKLYYPPYSFKRTGCKGCPFSMEIQNDLETLQELLPVEYQQCEALWEPVYSEYRRLKYRLTRTIEKDRLFSPEQLQECSERS
jgi:3'-phosphoadenosine 5'-phosphosulfate sulfotransferase (PAPS reductase)/FAD synthetase